MGGGRVSPRSGEGEPGGSRAGPVVIPPRGGGGRVPKDGDAGRMAGEVKKRTILKVSAFRSVEKGCWGFEKKHRGGCC